MRRCARPQSLVKFGRYQLQGRLGEGAAGAVYRAFDEALGRDVALKVLHKVDEVKAKRFEREAEVTARLDHPGVLKVHSFGVEGRVPFLVCELIESARTLAEVFQTAPLLERLDLIRQAAEAVGYAHEQGLVHRDLKPSNLLIDVAGRLRVADFGVATGENMERLTATGAWVGTPLYMSPEQLYSERDKIGPPSDVWALGALLFEALTDRLPFEAESPMELLSAARKPVRSPRTLAPELPREIERICLRALRLDPGERYPTGASFAAALTTYLAGDAQPARVPRGLLAILVGLASLAVVLAAVWGLSAPPAPAPTPVLTASAPALRLARPSVTSSTPDPRALAKASRAFAKALANPYEQERFEILSAWLSDHRSHPKSKRALRLLDELRWKNPLFDDVLFRRVTGRLEGILLGKGKFLAYMRASKKHPGSSVRIWRSGASPTMLEVGEIGGACRLPGSGGFVLWVLGEGVVVSLDGEELGRPVAVPALPRVGQFYLSALETKEGGWWLAIGARSAQVVLRISEVGGVTALPSLTGWPDRANLRGALLTPGPKLVLFGGERGVEITSLGLLLRFDARTGDLEQTLSGRGDLNAVSAVGFNPRDPAQIVVGTTFGRIVFRGGASNRALVSASVSKGALGERAHSSVLRFVGYSRDGSRLLTVSSAPAVAAVLRVWRAKDGAELRRVDLLHSFQAMSMADDRLLLLSTDRARVYRVD